MRNIASHLNDKLKSSQQTPAAKADPKMSVKVSRARTTVMDSDYWTVETIREKENLGDLALAPRRTVPYGSPNRIYEIHIDGTTVKTTVREYPDYLKSGWQPQFELGEGTAAAIAFDGHWQLFRGKWRIVTDQDPYIFWVDSSGVLWARLWDQEATLQQLASSVVTVRAIRGWKNVNFADRDQGIIAAYIKTDGKVYYRNYCIQPDETKVWEIEKQVSEFTATAINLNLFITNDYRVGIVVEDSIGNIYWYITARNWAGMAIVPDRFYAESKASATLIKTIRKDGYNDERFAVGHSMEIAVLYGSSLNEFIEAVNIDDGSGNYGLVIQASTRHELFNLQLTDFEIRDENSTRFSINNIIKLDAKNYEFSVEDFNSAYGNLTITCKGLAAKNEAGYLFNEFSISFAPAGLIPPVIPVPEVVEVYNE